MQEVKTGMTHRRCQTKSEPAILTGLGQEKKENILELRISCFFEMVVLTCQHALML